MKKICLAICCLLLTVVCPASAHGDGEGCLSVRANLLRWATLTPDIGVEWNGNENWGVLANGTWAHWSWDDKARHYALWEASVELRRYLCEKKRVYIGVQAKAGQFNHKLSDIGKQGDIVGGGLTGGYKLPIGKRFALDLSIGAGYLYINGLEQYSVTNGVRVKGGKSDKGYWGLTHLGVTLCYDIFKKD